MAISGSKVVVRAVSAAATVKVSGRPQPLPTRAPRQPCCSSATAWLVRVSRLLGSAAESPRCPGLTSLGMYQRNSESLLMRWTRTARGLDRAWKRTRADEAADPRLREETRLGRNARISY